MTRVDGWPDRLLAAVEEHAAAPLIWGVSDCFLFPFDCVRAVTGEDHAAEARGAYSTMEEGLALLRGRGHATVADAFASLFPEVPVAQAGRGDLGVIERPGRVMPVVFVDTAALGKGEDGGLRRVSRGLVTRAFKVG